MRKQEKGYFLVLGTLMILYIYLDYDNFGAVIAELIRSFAE